jgi:hypothetical protein
MECGGKGASTRAAKRKAVEKGKVIGEAIKKARVVIVSDGEEEELKLPFLETQVTMGQEHMDIIREMGRVMMESMNRNFEIMREQSNMEGERYRTMMENQGEQYRTMMENQNRNLREGADNLVEQFDRIAQEVARTQTAQKLPNYDGVNIEFDEWQDKVYACMTCNSWDIDRLLTSLPTSLGGQAKRSFDTLSADDKLSRDALFQALRKKLDPQAEKKNRELFILAKKGPSESIMTFIDRCRMYIRRSGGDPKEPFAVEMMKFKVYNSLTNTHRTILMATLGHDSSLETIASKAYQMLSAQPCIVGRVEGNIHLSQHKYQKDPTHTSKGDRSCWQCHQQGHIKRFCPLKNKDRNLKDQNHTSDEEYDIAQERSEAVKVNYSDNFSGLSFLGENDEKENTPLWESATSQKERSEIDQNLKVIRENKIRNWEKVPTYVYATVGIRGVKIRLGIDTGSVKTILSEEMFDILNADDRYILQQHDLKLTAINGSEITCLGYVNLPVVFYRHETSYVTTLKFYVIRGLEVSGLIGIDEICRNELQINLSNGTLFQPKVGLLHMRAMYKEDTAIRSITIADDMSFTPQSNRKIRVVNSEIWERELGSVLKLNICHDIESGIRKTMGCEEFPKLGVEERKRAEILKLGIFEGDTDLQLTTGVKLKFGPCGRKCVNWGRMSHKEQRIKTKIVDYTKRKVYQHEYGQNGGQNRNTRMYEELSMDNWRTKSSLTCTARKNRWRLGRPPDI